MRDRAAPRNPNKPPKGNPGGSLFWRSLRAPRLLPIG
jgi:hypothetical protein